MIKKQKLNIKCNFGTDAEEFRHYVGRYPEDREELQDWVNLIRKAIDSQLDWDVINQCAAAEFK
jgi:hypothetical protein